MSFRLEFMICVEDMMLWPLSLSTVTYVKFIIRFHN